MRMNSIMKTEIDSIILALIMVLVILAVLILAFTADTVREIAEIRETVEFYEEVNKERYDALEERVKKLENGTK